MPADLVVDASVAVSVGLGGERAGRLLDLLLSAGPRLHATELLDVEVAHAFRRYVRLGDLSVARAEQALDLIWRGLPHRRHPLPPLMARAWRLRERCSAYDATYVALAEALGAALITQDRRLERGVADLVAVVRPG